MGKKYLETKKDSLEASVLGVWKTAIEEGDARETAVMDGRTKSYKSHRAKLETARQRREGKTVNKEEVELDEVYSVEELEELYLELSDEEFDDILEESDEEFLNELEVFFTEDIQGISEKGFLKKMAKKIGGAIAKRVPGTSAKRKHTIAKADKRASQRTAKADKVKAKNKEKKDYEKAKGYLKKKKKAGVFGDETLPNMMEASGDKEAYKKFFDAALKKFKVSSPAEFKSDEEKKKFYDYIDKNWEADDEKAEAAMSQVREFKIQSMKAALAQVWGMEEGKNPFKSEDHDDDEEMKKKVKTETGKKPAAIDLKPKIDDR